MTHTVDLNPYLDYVSNSDPLQWTGEVTDVVGMLIESRGPAVALGDFCEIETGSGRSIRTQVAGFREGRVLSIPLEETDGLQLGATVIARSEDSRVGVGPDLLGRVLDGFGKTHG